MSRPDPFAALGPLPERAGVAELLRERAARDPGRAAVVEPRGAGWKRTSYGELARRVRDLAAGLHARGVGGGTRVALFVRPSAELIALAYALFELGAVPVLADPGMGRARLLACMARTRPRAFAGVPRAQLARLFFRAPFRTVELFVTVGRRGPWSGPTLEQLEREGARAPDAPRPDTAAGDPAAILFTSGSTGPPKGVVYTHGNFLAQVRALGALYGFREGEVDLACFPLFALFGAAFGMTCVLPALDPSRPGSCDPERIVAAIREHGATTTFGSPAIWQRVVPWCRDRGLRLDSLARVTIAGAPVPPKLIADFLELLPEGAELHTPYGATECLPVASLSSRELFQGLVELTANGAGTCVGRPAPGIDLRLIELRDGAIEEWSDALEVPFGRPGEVCVRGPVVTREYAGDAEHTRLHKMRPAPGEAGVWHRVGDVGRLDAEGRLWFYGRKDHRLETERGTRLPVPAENVFALHPRVRRCALVGVGPRGKELPLLVVEPVAGAFPADERAQERFLLELVEVGARAHASKDVKLFLFHRSLPVDVRHNAKIDREALKRWAEAELA